MGISPSPHLKLVHAAKEKPTGEANHSELLEMALRIDEALDVKAGSALLDDDLFEGDSKGESETGGVPDRRKVIHVTSDGDSVGEDSSKAKQVKSTSHVVKGFRTADPLQLKPRKMRASTSQAAEAMASIGAYFSPDHIRERVDANASNSVQFLQLQSALTELREVCSRNEQLTGSLHLQTIRADKLEIQMLNLKDKLEDVKAENRKLKMDLRTLPQQHHCRHNTESDSDTSHLQQMPRRRRWHHDNPPSPSTQRDGAITQDALAMHARNPNITSLETN